MNKQRAREIASSPNMKNVVYNGQSIYIEKVDDAKGTAVIHPLDDPRDKREVPVENLNEIK